MSFKSVMKAVGGAAVGLLVSPIVGVTAPIWCPVVGAKMANGKRVMMVQKPVVETTEVPAEVQQTTTAEAPKAATKVAKVAKETPVLQTTMQESAIPAV